MEARVFLYPNLKSVVPPHSALKTALLKDHLYNIKFDPIVQWFLVYSWSCAAITTEHLKTFALSQKEAPYPWAVASLPPAPQP